MPRGAGGDSKHRDEASRLAPVDWRKALAAADRTRSPWYRCQALAWVARFAPDGEVERIARSALASAARATDPYERVGAAAWPLRALLERERPAKVAGALPKLLSDAGAIQSPASRSEAVFLLLECVFPYGEDLWRPVFGCLCEALSPLLHWRQRRNLRDAVLMVASVDPELADEVVAGIGEESLIRRIDRDGAAGRFPGPRAFFWTGDLHAGKLKERVP